MFKGLCIIKFYLNSLLIFFIKVQLNILYYLTSDKYGLVIIFITLSAIFMPFVNVKMFFIWLSFYVFGTTLMFWLVLKIDFIKSWFYKHIGYSYITLRIGNPGERALKVVVKGGIIIAAGLSDVIISHEYVKSYNHIILTESQPELYKILVDSLRENFSVNRLEHKAELFDLIKKYQQTGISTREAIDLANKTIMPLEKSFLDIKDFREILAKVRLEIPLIEKPIYGFVTDSLLKNIPQALDNIGDVFKYVGSKFK